MLELERRLLIILLLLLLSACGGGAADPDGGTDRDAGLRIDAVVPREDSGVPRDSGADAIVIAPDSGPTSCTRDEDCAPTGWCRPTMSGGMQCVPFVGEGGSCGGFRPAWASERCEAALTCMQRNPLIADAPGSCVIETTVAELIGDIDGFLGHWVGIRDSYVRAAGELGGCTERACPPDMLCCNDCVAPHTLHDDAASLATYIQMDTEAGESYDCAGDNCNYLSMCDLSEGRHVAIGIFREVYLSVRSIQPYEFPP